MPRQLRHKHPANIEHHERATFGQRMAERLARVVGSWTFLICQTLALSAWIVLNVTGVFVRPWDIFPFIFLNLMLSFQAAYTGPILQITGNRAAERDRLTLEHSAEQTEQHSVMLKQQREELAALRTLLEENTKITRMLAEGNTAAG